MNYNRLIETKLKGETPHEKYENLRQMKRFLQIAAYPKKYGNDEPVNIFSLAKLIQDKFTTEDLDILSTED